MTLQVNAPPSVCMTHIRCTGLLKNGRTCDHLVAKIPLELWEQSIADEVELECRRCGKVEKLKEWR